MSAFAILALIAAALAVLSGFLRWWVWRQARKSGQLEEKLGRKLRQEAVYRELNAMSGSEDERAPQTAFQRPRGRWHGS